MKRNNTHTTIPPTQRSLMAEWGNALKWVFATFFVLNVVTSKAQNNAGLAGNVYDATQKQPLIGANVVATNTTISNVKSGASADENGAFAVSGLPKGNYQVVISFIGYKNDTINISLDNTQKDLGTIYLQENTAALAEVEVKGVQQRVTMKGDTLQYNADAFKTYEGASSNDLVKKLPGVTSEGSTIKVNGEEVKKVLVDGKPFFGDDPSATLNNLPAYIVDKVEMFDEKSDQARFTGFDDGNEEKTINLTTRPGMNVGTFGNVYAGYGSDRYYNAGFALHRFNGAQRISLLGMTNNINEQNFSISDIMSVMSNSGSSRRGGPPGSGGVSFFNGQQSGLTNTNGLGLNYTDNWGEKIKVSGSYFFNNTDNNNTSTVDRDYYTEDGLQYTEESTSQTTNTNHRANFKFEYEISKNDKLTLSPSLTVQQNSQISSVLGNSFTDSPLNSTLTDQVSENSGFNFANNVLYQHKFNKKGRTISLNINTERSNQSGDKDYFSESISALSGDTSAVDQKYNTENASTTLGASLAYTEPLGANGQLLIAYRPSWTSRDYDKQVFDNQATEDSSLVTGLSNVFASNYNIQKGGVSYQFNKGNHRFTIGADAQSAVLTGTQTYPNALEVNRSFFNVLPNARYSFKTTKQARFEVDYRSSTEAPSITNLQNSIDVSNAQFISSGNPDLTQTFNNNFNVRLFKRIPENEHHFGLFLRGTVSEDYVSNSTSFFSTDTVIQGVQVSQGSQFSKPINVSGYYSANAFGIYGFPIAKIKSNFTLRGGYSLTNTPAYINNELNNSLNNALSGGFYLGSNISEYLDFSLSYNGSFNTVTNSLQTQSDNRYYNHTVGVDFHYIYKNRLTFGTDVNESFYVGVSDSYRQNYTIWNAEIGYKFLKDRSLELKVSVYDLLKQNTSLAQTITETYAEESQTATLQRYGMVSLVYTFKKFKDGAVGPEEFKVPAGMPPPGKMPRPGR